MMIQGRAKFSIMTVIHVPHSSSCIYMRPVKIILDYKMFYCVTPFLCCCGNLAMK